MGLQIAPDQTAEQPAQLDTSISKNHQQKV